MSSAITTTTASAPPSDSARALHKKAQIYVLAQEARKHWLTTLPQRFSESVFKQVGSDYNVSEEDKQSILKLLQSGVDVTYLCTNLSCTQIALETIKCAYGVHKYCSEACKVNNNAAVFDQFMFHIKFAADDSTSKNSKS